MPSFTGTSVKAWKKVKKTSVDIYYIKKLPLLLTINSHIGEFSEAREDLAALEKYYEEVGMDYLSITYRISKCIFFQHAINSVYFFIFL